MTAVEKNGRIIFALFAIMFLAGLGWGATWVLNTFFGFDINYIYSGIPGLASAALVFPLMALGRFLARRKSEEETPIGIGGAYPTELTPAQKAELEIHRGWSEEKRQQHAIVSKTMHVFLLTMVFAGGVGGLFWGLDYFNVIYLPFAIPGVISTASASVGLFGFLYEKLVVRR